MKTNLKNFLKAFSLSVVAVVLVAGIYSYIDINPSDMTEAEKSVNDYAKELVNLCADADYRPYCYEKAIPKLTSELETYKIFDVIRAIRQYDEEYLFCHVAAHELGQYEVAKDPNNWLDVLAQSPSDGLCSNGFAHGAVVARFNGETFSDEELVHIIEEFKLVCEPRDSWDPTNLQRAMCYHGLGHVLVHVTEADVSKSLAACEEIAYQNGEDFRRVCREGVYMQLFQPLEPEDYALIDSLEMKPNRENIQEFCQLYSQNNAEFDVCWREAWPFFNEDIHTAEGIENYCNVIKGSAGEDQCYVTAFTINGRHYLGDKDFIKSVCDFVAYKRQGICYGVAANAYIEEDPQLAPAGIQLCALVEDSVVQSECYEYLVNVADFNFHQGSEAFISFCEALPAKWVSKCKRK